MWSREIEIGTRQAWTRFQCSVNSGLRNEYQETQQVVVDPALNQVLSSFGTMCRGDPINFCETLVLS